MKIINDKGEVVWEGPDDTAVVCLEASGRTAVVLKKPENEEESAHAGVWSAMCCAVMLDQDDLREAVERRIDEHAKDD